MKQRNATSVLCLDARLLVSCPSHSPDQFDADMYGRRPNGRWGLAEVARAAGMTLSFTFTYGLAFRWRTST